LNSTIANSTTNDEPQITPLSSENLLIRVRKRKRERERERERERKREREREKFIFLSFSSTIFQKKGTTLRNTAFVNGIVIFSGPDTKFVLNMTKTPSKRSHLERLVNQMIFGVLLFILLLLIASAIAGTIYQVGQIPFVTLCPCNL
jgi:magnesium-transporting ATPase (P-type)